MDLERLAKLLNNVPLHVFTFHDDYHVEEDRICMTNAAQKTTRYLTGKAALGQLELLKELLTGDIDALERRLGEIADFLEEAEEERFEAAMI